MLSIEFFATPMTATNRSRVEMTKTFTHSAIYFASVVFLSVSIGAISDSYAESALGSESIIFPVLKKKISKPIVEEVVELEAKAKPKKRTFVRRRKDPVVPPKVRPALSENGEVFELAQLGPHAELPAEKTDNEAASTVNLDSVTTSSVILDQDQPQDGNVSAAAGSESAADADELALLKAEIASLKAQLLSEKESAAKLTGDLVRAKENATDLTKTPQADVTEGATTKPAAEARTLLLKKKSLRQKNPLRLKLQKTLPLSLKRAKSQTLNHPLSAKSLIVTHLRQKLKLKLRPRLRLRRRPILLLKRRIRLK